MVNGKHGQETHITKMGADQSAKNTPNAPKNVWSNLSAQAQKFEIFEKKLSTGVRSSWYYPFRKQNYQIQNSMNPNQASKKCNEHENKIDWKTFQKASLTQHCYHL